MNCDALNAESTRLLNQRDELKSPLLPTNTDTEREAEVTQLNGKLYTVSKAQSDKRCPLGAAPLLLCGRVVALPSLASLCRSCRLASVIQGLVLSLVLHEFVAPCRS